jgi:membrane associated rhomboid family serine protease
LYTHVEQTLLTNQTLIAKKSPLIMSEGNEQIRPSAHQKKAKAVNTIIVINVIIFILVFWLGTSYNLNLYNILALHHPTSPLFELHQLITHIFMHGGYFHIFINMFILWMFGTVLETIWGTKRFLMFYFFTGLGAAALHLAVNTYSLNQLQDSAIQYVQSPTYEGFVEFKEEHLDPIPPRFSNRADQLAQEWRRAPGNTIHVERSIDLVQEYVQTMMNRPTVGASGAIFGLLLAFGVLFPNVKIYLYFLFPIKAKFFVIGLGLIELYSGLFGQNVGIANFAHLGGMVFGFILLKIWGDKAKPVQKEREVYDDYEEVE